MQLTVEQIMRATGGVLLRGDRNVIVERVCTDTRTIQPGDGFVALRGRNFNGEDFVPRALEMGAAGVICAGDVTLYSQRRDAFVLQVLDTTTAIGDIARAWRRQVNPAVVAVTGSAGKTTTKEMIAHICRGSIPVHATEGNKNNQIGLPLTLMRLRPDHQVAITEMGMNHGGELTQLAAIAEPSIACLTNIGDAHLGNFRDLNGLIAAKAELIEALPEDGLAIINADCANTPALTSRHKMPSRVVYFGTSGKADVEGRSVKQCQPFGYRFQLCANGDCVPVYLPVFGRYMVHNALAAAAVAVQLGIPMATIAERLETFQPLDMRSKVETIDGVQLIEDCYNASPAATVAAIRSFAEVTNVSRRFMLLGDMYELGLFAEDCHRRVGEAVAQGNFDLTVCVGSQARWIAQEALDRGATVAHVETHEEAAEVLHAQLTAGDAVLIKGSRGARLETAVSMLRSKRTQVREGGITTT